MSKYAGGALFLLIGVVVLVASHDFMGAPMVSNDAVQYLDAAEHLVAGDCFCTTLAHFDEQIGVGHMPVPFTHFAPGYPLLIAAFMRLGVKPELAGYVISAVSYLLTLVLFWYIGKALRIDSWVLLAFGLLWATNSIVIVFADSLSTEALFTAILLAIAAVMIADINMEGRRPALLLAIGILAGAAYWVRYPGLFVVPGTVLFLLWRCWKTRRSWPWVLAGLAAASGECLAIMLRNYRLIGSWRGGFSAGQGHSIKFIVVESVKAFYHIAFGDRVVAHLNIWAILFLCSFVAAVALAVLAWRSGRAAELPPNFALLAGWPALLVAIYGAGIIYAAMHSIASDLGRYYFPAYPLVLAILAAATLAHKTLEKAVLTVLVIAVLAVHSRSLLTKPNPPLIADVQRVFSEDVKPGDSLGQWLAGHVSRKDVLIAVNGQAVHYILQRPVVSMIQPIYSDHVYDDAGFHALMAQFGARYVLLFPGSTLTPEQDEIPFLHALAAGSYPPWLSVAAKTRDATLYECGDCALSRLR